MTSFRISAHKLQIERGEPLVKQFRKELFAFLLTGSGQTDRLTHCGSITHAQMFQVKVEVHTIWCQFGQFKFVQKYHFQINTNQSYISI